MSKAYSVQFGAGDPRTYTGLSPTFLIFARLTDGATLAPPSITEALTGSGFYTFSYGVTQPIAFLVDAATSSPGTAGRYVSGQIDPNDRSDEYGNTLTAIGFSNLVYGSSLFAFGNTLTSIGYSNLVYGASNFALGTTSVAYLVAASGVGVAVAAMGTTLIGVGSSSLAAGQSLAGLAAFVGTTASSFGSTSIDPSTLFGFLKRAQEIQEGAQVYTKASGLWDLYDRTQTTLLREKTISDSSSQTTKT